MAEDQNLKDAQYRKSLSISYFNSLNAAIEMVKTRMNLVNLKPETASEAIKGAIVFWRDFFIQEHADYYAKTIASVGEPYNAEKTVKNLQKAKSMEELEQKWLNLSQDERRDKVVIKGIADMKAILKKPKVEKTLPKKPVKTNEKPRQHKARVPRVAPDKKG